MIRSKFAITRLIIVPYSILLVLYLVVVGGGGTWLYLQMRSVETQLLVNRIMADIEPLAQKLKSTEHNVSLEGPSWFVADVQRLFEALPSLRNVSLRGRESGLAIDRGADGAVAMREAPPLPIDIRRASTDSPMAERLHNESGGEFVVRFDLTPTGNVPAQLEFGFDRAMLLARIDAGVDEIREAVVWFGLVGGVSILAALGITAFAIRTTRRIEAHFQEIYRRASITKLAAELVHDLRNPLMALRSNIKALLISPEQTGEIVSEMDRDVTSLNDKLNGFLKLTRHQVDEFKPTDIAAVVHDAVRLAEPLVAEHGLRVEVDVPREPPPAVLQEDSVRDALVNLIANAAQSGQRKGAITVAARVRDGFLVVTVEDRGEGIASEHASRLFDAFYTTKPEGNGLGLSIVKRIVTDHHGSVSIENRTEGGARVVLKLPLRPKEVPSWWRLLKQNGQT